MVDLEMKLNIFWGNMKIEFWWKNLIFEGNILSGKWFWFLEVIFNGMDINWILSWLFFSQFSV